MRTDSAIRRHKSEPQVCNCAGVALKSGKFRGTNRADRRSNRTNRNPAVKKVPHRPSGDRLQCVRHWGNNLSLTTIILHVSTLLGVHAYLGSSTSIKNTGITRAGWPSLGAGCRPRRARARSSAARLCVRPGARCPCTRPPRTRRTGRLGTPRPRRSTAPCCLRSPARNPQTQGRHANRWEPRLSLGIRTPPPLIQPLFFVLEAALGECASPGRDRCR